MDIDQLNFSGFDLQEFVAKTEPPPPTKLVKQTVFQSPIFTNIIHNFKVRIDKPFRGLHSDSLNDESYQTLLPREPDSQLDAFSEDDTDDELLMELTSKPPEATKSTTQYPSRTKSIEVIIKTKSVVVDGVEFTFGCEVRSSCLVRGIDHDAKEGAAVSAEDSLFVSLKSGYLLLLRMYYVPRYYKDSDYQYQTDGLVEHGGDSIFKPFIVQWWSDTSNSVNSLKMSGHQLSAHRSGLAVVSTSASDGFRVYTTQPTSNGLMFKKHVNVECSGLILNSCFAEPLHIAKVDHHSIFLTMVFTDFRRLALNLYSWSSIEDFGQSFNKSTLPLDNSFVVPVFIVSIGSKGNGAFLFVSNEELVIVTVHDIISAEYNFRRIVPPWKDVSFPTSYYRPETSILGEDSEILVSTDNGTIYSISVTSTIEVVPLVRVNDPISVFSLERSTGFRSKEHQGGYRLIYGSDTGSNKDVMIPELLDSSSKYSRCFVTKDYKKWAPLVDISVVDSCPNRLTNNQSKQELWGITGHAKKTKLTHFKHGYSGQRISNTYEKLRKAERIQFVQFESRVLLFCSFTFETILLEYQPNYPESFIEIDTDVFVKDDSTIYVRSLESDGDEYVLQITSSAIVLSDLNGYQVTLQQSILDCHVCDNRLVVLTETATATTARIYEITPNFHRADTFENSQLLTHVADLQVHEPSLVRLSSSLLAVGTYQGTVDLYRLDPNGQLSLINTLVLSSLSPYDQSHTLYQDLLIPSDIVFLQDKLFVGTMDGYLVSLECNHDYQNIACKSFLRLSEVQLKFSIIDNPNFLFIYTKSLWLLNMYESEYPQKVFFDETYEKPVVSMCHMPYGETYSKDSRSLQFAFVRDDGLVLGKVFTFKEPNIRQISLEHSQKLYYLPFLSIFIVLCKVKNSAKRMRFIDRKSFKELPSSIEISSKDKMFEQNEYPLCSCIWSIKRNNRVSKKVLVGAAIESEVENSDETTKQKGTFKVLDITKIRSKSDGTYTLKVTQLTSFDHHEPISNIIQIESDIIFTSGKSIYCTSYNFDEKRLKSIKLLASFSSTVISLSLDGTIILVTTRLDSCYQFNYTSNSDSLTIKCVNNDPLPNRLTNQAPLDSKIVAGDKLHSSIYVVENDQSRTSPPSRINYRISSIPWVYSCNFTSFWIQDTEDEKKMVLTMGINGEVTVVRSLANDDDELFQLNKQLGGLSIEEEIEKLARPFLNKVSGTGLFSINKPSFDYRENKGLVLDYDLDEISKISPTKVLI